MQFLEKLKPLGLLVLRVALGASFIVQGYPQLSDPGHAPKLFPGYGLPGFSGYMFGILEVFGGGLIIAGLLTRGAALLLAIEMGVLLDRSLIPAAGIYAFGHYEFPLLLCATAFALATTGAGLISIDAFTFESSRKPARKFKSKD
jgi:putative oxidoreductase